MTDTDREADVDTEQMADRGERVQDERLEREELRTFLDGIALEMQPEGRNAVRDVVLAHDAAQRAEIERLREALEGAADTFGQIKRRTRKYKGTRNHYCKQREMAQAAHDAAEVAADRARHALEHEGEDDE